MSRVGLVLGGGGITGAAYEIAALMALRIATDWDPNEADVVVGTSSGAFVSALVRYDSLSLDSVVLPTDDREDVTRRIREHVYSKDASASVGKWMRYGLVPGVRNPGLTMFLGSPARYSAKGIAEWVTSNIGEDAAAGWPSRPTAIMAHDIQKGTRAAFGTDSAPDAGIADAVAASSAVPLVFRPYRIGEGLYVDGGVSSGTHADVVLGHDAPLDLVLVVAPMAAQVQRARARFHEKMFDRVGLKSLRDEIAMITEAWPDCDVVTLFPSPSVQNAMRPNPMDASRSVATFMRTIISMKRTLARPDIWEKLDHHLVGPSINRRAAAR
ncbi:MAG TPA: patatin-like phospholipase family protein [Acidimicrobiia bacterium]|nr:patatin-like phospholipase family protein [Acidimicrobiia bacterium]